MFDKLGPIFTSVMGWLGDFVSSLTTEGGDLAGLGELLLLGVGISLVMVCAKIVRKVMWGA